jgi:hypothetical protein
MAGGTDDDAPDDAPLLPPMEGMAVWTHEMYVSYIEAGFSYDQAFTLCLQITQQLTANLKGET